MNTERRRRKDELLESLENQKHIAKIVCTRFRSGSGWVTFRANPFLEPSTVLLAKMILRKPFLTSWSSFLPRAALADEDVFEALSGGIFLTAQSSETPNDFWDGKGNYQRHVKLADISTFTGVARIAAFSALLMEPVYLEVRPYLELPRYS